MSVPWQTLENRLFEFMQQAQSGDHARKFARRSTCRHLSGIDRYTLHTQRSRPITIQKQVMPPCQAECS